MKKYFTLCLLTLVALLLVLPGCADSKIETLKKELAKYNATCPQSLGTDVSTVSTMTKTARSLCTI